MAVLTKEDFMNTLKTKIGEDTSDEAMKFLEDMTDTFNDLESKSTSNGEDWKQKYDDLDKSWREKYTARFFSTATDGAGVENNSIDNSGAEENVETFEDLFTESEV